MTQRERERAEKQDRGCLVMTPRDRQSVCFAEMSKGELLERMRGLICRCDLKLPFQVSHNFIISIKKKTFSIPWQQVGILSICTLDTRKQSSHVHVFENTSNQNLLKKKILFYG